MGNSQTGAAGVDGLIQMLGSLGSSEQERALITGTLRALDEHYGLGRKIAAEPGTGEIVKQLMGRIYRAYRGYSAVRGKRVLDIACGSNSSRMPTDLADKSPFADGARAEGFTALFEPWFCRMLLELGAEAVGVDFGDLRGERFEHYAVDLGVPGALDFLPDQSFDAVQDSRLFGSPEFTAQFPSHTQRRRVALEIWQQEKRVLKPGGVVIHSDAAVLLR